MSRELHIGSGVLKGALDANGQRVVNLSDPMSDNDAATKKYVDGKMAKDGLSAYEVAVKNGFDGTEEEWLASLKGRDGKGSDIMESVSTPGNAFAADFATHATTADSAEMASSCNYAQVAVSADKAKYAEEAGSAETAKTADSAVAASHAAFAESSAVAERAFLADRVQEADVAEYARNAAEASHASASDTAGSATNDSAGNNISTTYAKKEDVHDAKITFTQGGVEKGSFTLNQSAPGTIELDAGGGGGGGGGGDAKCLLFVNHNGSSYQHVQWTGKDAEGKTHTYKVTRDSTSIQLRVDDVVVPSAKQGSYNYNMLVQVDGVLTLADNGYHSESMCVVDNAPGPTSGTIDTAGHHSVSVYFQECLEQSTPITMSDGTTKPVCELHDGDKVMSVNPDTMQVEEDEVCACDAGCVKQHNKADVWTFADGTSVTTVKPHQFYNVRTGRMEYIADFRIGDEVRKADGSATALTGHETRYGVTYHNTLYTKRYNNYFAGGILAGNRHSVKWGWRWRQDNGEE